MRKKWLLLILAGLILILTFVVGLLGTSNNEMAANEPDDKLVILMPFNNSDFLFESQWRQSGLENLEEYVKSYNLVKEPDFEIEIRYIETTDENSYISQRNAMLLGENQPELFFISNWSDGDVILKSYAKELIESGKAMYLREAFDNYKYLFKGLDFDYYVPIGIDAYVPGYTDSVSGEYGFDYNDEEVSLEQEREMLFSWLSHKQKPYDWRIDTLIFEGLINPKGMLSKDFMKVELSVSDIMERVDRIKEAFEDEKLIVLDGMTYEELIADYRRYANRYYRSAIEYGEMKNSYPMDFYRKANLVKPNQVAIELYHGGRTYYKNNPREIKSVGFMINKQAGDLEAAYDFINYLLEPAPQLSHYLYYGAYPGIVTTSSVERVEAEEKKAHTSKQAMRQWQLFYSSLPASQVPHMTTEDVALINAFEHDMVTLLRQYFLMDDIKRSEVKRKLYEMINTYEFKQVE